MTNRESTLLAGRVKRIEKTLNRTLVAAAAPPQPPLKPEERAHLKEAAEDLYWNELEWEKLTGEEQLDEEFVTELAFPGFLAFVKGLLLTETMPDSPSPARPSPEVVRDLLEFLALRVVTLDEDQSELEDEELAQREAELKMTSRLIDFVLYQLYALEAEEIEEVEAGLLSG